MRRFYAPLASLSLCVFGWACCAQQLPAPGEQRESETHVGRTDLAIREGGVDVANAGLPGPAGGLKARSEGSSRELQTADAPVDLWSAGTLQGLDISITRFAEVDGSPDAIADALPAAPAPARDTASSPTSDSSATGASKWDANGVDIGHGQIRYPNGVILGPVNAKALRRQGIFDPHPYTRAYWILNGIHVGSAFGDILLTHHCIADGHCREGNPLLPGPLPAQMGVEVGLCGFVAWASGTAKRSYNPHWRIDPIMGIAVHAVGMSTGIAHW